MPTITVNLSLEQYASIEAEAKKREVSFSRAIRDRLSKKPKFPDDHKCPEAKPSVPETVRARYGKAKGDVVVLRYNSKTLEYDPE